MGNGIHFLEDEETPKVVEEQLTFNGFDLPSKTEKEEQKKQEKEQKKMVKKIIEALLFVSTTPLSFFKLRELIESKFPLKPKILRDALDDLQEDCLKDSRAYRLEETADGFQFKTCAEFAPFIDELFRNKRTEKLSTPSLEVLAIIAYKQPISRAQIEVLRGVDCSGTLQNLIERELIHPVGKMEAPGRPTLYGTTSHFLQHFGLKNLMELPPLPT